MWTGIGAAGFGVAGGLLGYAIGNNLTRPPVPWELALLGGLLAAILGAVVGGVADITRAIRDRRPPAG